MFSTVFRFRALFCYSLKFIAFNNFDKLAFSETYLTWRPLRLCVRQFFTQKSPGKDFKK